jgi:hypothetical protein
MRVILEPDRFDGSDPRESIEHKPQRLFRIIIAPSVKSDGVPILR